MNNVSPKNAPFGVQSMSAGSIEAISPISGTRIQHVDLENHHRQELRCLSSRELGSNSVDSRSERGSSSGKPDWAINKEEPNFSFFRSPLEETPHEVEGAVYNGHGSNLKNELEHLGAVLAKHTSSETVSLFVFTARSANRDCAFVASHKRLPTGHYFNSVSPDLFL
ncbi:hypothetical protein Tco_1543403 [Tanacetum coccineum]